MRNDRKRENFRERIAPNPNRVHLLYLMNIILLCVIALAALAFMAFFVVRWRDSQREIARINAELNASEGQNKSLYTGEQVDELVERAQAEGRTKEGRTLRMQIQSSLESGDSTIEMLRELYPDDVVVAYDGRYFFYPRLKSVAPNAFGEQDFKIDADGLLTYDGREKGVTVRNGIDVSQAQGYIDWGDVQKAGMEFAMLRVGSRGDDGTIARDTMFQYNANSCRNYGIDYGVYWLLGARDSDEALEEAKSCVEELQALELTPKEGVCVAFRMPGEESRQRMLSAKTFSELLEVFCEEIRGAGYTPMIAGSMTGLIMRTDPENLEQFGKWVLDTSGRMAYPYSFHMWRYGTGTVDGVPVEVNRDAIVTRSTAGEPSS